MALNPKDAFFLGYLPAVVSTTLVNYAIVDMIESNAAGDAKLEAACKFSRQAIKVSESEMQASYNSIREKLEKLTGTPPPPLPEPRGYELWSRQVAAAASAAASPEPAAYELGSAAGEVHMAMWIARNLIYLRSSAPQHATLGAQVEHVARQLASAQARLDAALDKVGATAAAQGKQIRAIVARTPAIAALSGAGEMASYFDWATELGKRLAALGRGLDRPVDEPMTGPPTAEERALLERIVVDPEDDAPRKQLAQLAKKRRDPRAELIEEQLLVRDLRRGGPMGPGEVTHMKRAAQLAQMHPEWTEPVLALGVKEARLRRGFVDEIVIDAQRFLEIALELFQLAPVLHVHFTRAAGKVDALARSAHVARLRSIGLADNQLGDDDIAALAASPSLERLRWLDLSRNHITNRGVEALALSSRLPSLVYVGLAGNPCDSPIDTSYPLDETTEAWEMTPAGEALEAKAGRKLKWVHPRFERRPPDVDDV